MSEKLADDVVEAAPQDPPPEASPQARPPARAQQFDRRMTDAEALMWNIEKDPWLNPNGGSLFILDGPIDLDDFTARIAHAVVEVPRLRERVVPTLGRFSPPLWRADPEFDLAFHIRHLTLNAPGTMRELLDLVTSLYQDPYDRSRPLWQFFVIDGLEDGRSALFWKVHHAIADGIGLGYLAEYHVHRRPDPEPPPEVDLAGAVRAAIDADENDQERTPVPTAVVRTTGHLIRRQAGIARRLTSEVAIWGADPLRVRDAAGDVVSNVRQVRTQLLGEGGGSDDSGSPLWRHRSRQRHLEVLTVPLEASHAAAKALGGSLNDFFVAGAVNGALAYHQRRGAPVKALNISFVVSTRAKGDKAIGGNSFTPARLRVSGEAMPADERFAEVHERMAAKRSEVKGAGLLSTLAGVANLLPTSLVTRTARAQAAKQDFATSNLRGPGSTRYVSGATVVGNYPFGPVAGTAFNLTTISYLGELSMGLFIDPAAVEAPGELRDDLVAAYDELIAAGATG